VSLCVFRAPLHTALNYNKISSKFTAYPLYRYYTQTASNYFAAYEQHLSTEILYFSYDLSKFVSNQYGLTYTDIFTQAKIFI
jgi:hypothetical protein